MHNQDLNIETVLSPAFLQLWDNSLLGVMILDGEGLVLYVNKILARTDELLNVDVIRKPLDSFYPMEKNDHLSIQAMNSGKPVLKKTVIYYTNKNKLVNSLVSSFPLSSKGKVEGAIHFSLNLQISQNLFSRYTGPKQRFAGADHHLAKPLKYTFASIIGNTEELSNAVTYAKANCYTDFPALIWAETGCGKELFAQAIHYESPRANKPFIPINCAAIPENLLETTLFGTAKGAFTGAVDKAGLIEIAEGGTLLLDELNSMSLEMQAKLLRVIQEKRIRRVGAHEEKSFDVKFISTCNISPRQALDENRIRIDLFYRLAVVVIEIPKLKERKPDIPLLCEHFLAKWALNELPGDERIKVSDEVYSIFEKYDWPGNVRELEHTLKACLTALGTEKTIYKDHLSPYFIANYEKQYVQANHSEPLIHEYSAKTYHYDEEQAEWPNQNKLCLASEVKAFEKKHIERALKRAGYNISKAGRLLDLSPQSLRYKINKLNIQVINE